MMDVQKCQISDTEPVSNPSGRSAHYVSGPQMYRGSALCGFPAAIQRAKNAILSTAVLCEIVLTLPGIAYTLLWRHIVRRKLTALRRVAPGSRRDDPESTPAGADRSTSELRGRTTDASMHACAESETTLRAASTLLRSTPSSL